jgi:hypothetical protein
MINIGKALASAACLAALSAHAYDSATVENRTTYPVTINVEYAACKGDWFDVPAGTVVKDGITPGKAAATSKRGGCLIRTVKAIFKGDGAGKAVTTYTSSGTSYSRFIVQGADDNYRVWSLQELTAENAMTREGKSPGFYIVNKTKWPVAVALEQVGCLYYGTLKPGEVFNRNTGAVWFTIKANIQADGKEPRKDWDCVKPVAAVVGAILISAATAGAASWAALPAAGAAGAALSPIATSSAVIVAGAATKGALTATGSWLVKTTAGELGGKLDSTSAASLKGQYAGPDWPFRCNAKPSYEIVGGWGPTGLDKDGNLAIDPGVPLQILKTNGCGSSMSTAPAVSAKR